MDDLAKLARSLHRNSGMTPEQIRNRSGFLDSNYNPYLSITTIRKWLGEENAGATPRQASISSSNITPRVVASLDRIQEGEDQRTLHDQVARLEAHLNRLSCERASGTPRPARSCPVAQERSRAGSLFVEPRDNNREMIAQLKQMNTQLVELVTAAVGTVACRNPDLVTAALGTVACRNPVDARQQHVSASAHEYHRDSSLGVPLSSLGGMEPAGGAATERRHRSRSAPPAAWSRQGGGRRSDVNDPAQFPQRH